MYILAFLASYFLVKYQIRKKGLTISINTVNDLFLFLIIGLIIGARLGYVVFYNLPFYLGHPLKLFAIWEGGMSFHGGLIGIIFSSLIFVKKHKASFWAIADLISVTAPIGLGLGRLGNFINAELYGRVTHLPWGMIFPSGGVLPRHPSQLYELFLEGILLFIVLWWLISVYFSFFIASFVFLSSFSENQTRSLALSFPL
jgi:phosphatidylglycerol:prolipoprotein diacylglycerol transferase